MIGVLDQRVLPGDAAANSWSAQRIFDVSTLVGKGNHLLTLRGFDEAGNFVVRSIELK